MLLVKLSLNNVCSAVGDFIDVRLANGKAVHITQREDGYAVLETEICDVCRTLSSGSVLLGARRSNGTTTFNILVDSPAALGQVLRRLTQMGYRPRVVERARYVAEPRLTKDQIKALVAAYQLGLFDESRNASVKDLAARLGISTAAASRMLRRAIRRLVEHYLAQLGLLDDKQQL